LIRHVKRIVAVTPVAFASSPVWEAHSPIHLRGSATATYSGGYQPSQIRNAYGLSRISLTGANQTIAIVDPYGSPTIQNDVATFDHQFGNSSVNPSRFDCLGFRPSRKETRFFFVSAVPACHYGQTGVSIFKRSRR